MIKRVFLSFVKISVMKVVSTFRLLFPALFCMALFLSCEKEKETEVIPPVVKSLYVKFINDSRSVVSIYSISVMNMGAVQSGKGASTISEGSWSANLISGGAVIAPGGHQFFTLNIAPGDYAQYRIGVVAPGGQQILLHEQSGYQGENPPITHWGGDDRTVSVTVWKNEPTGQYYIAGWSDFVGISN